MMYSKPHMLLTFIRVVLIFAVITALPLLAQERKEVLPSNSEKEHKHIIKAENPEIKSEDVRLKANKTKTSVDKQINHSDREASSQLQKNVSPNILNNNLTSKPEGPDKYSCTSGVGCNCWGNADCDALVQSGKCHGNPLTCDSANPNSCHCK